MSRPISLDLIVCTYDNAPLLDRTLAAIAAQRVSPEVRWSVLVVDNNSSDETPQVLARHAERMPVPFRTVREPRQGLTPARLCGVRHTAGEWLAFIDDDCLLAEDWVEQAAAFALEHPEAGAFGGRVVLEWDAEPPPPHVRGYGWAYAETDLGPEPLRRDWLAGAGMVLRRRALEETGWTEAPLLEDRIGKRLVSGGDVEIGLRVAAAHEVWYHPGCTLRHVIPPHRTRRRYLGRMLLGLGASAHVTGALAWRGTYAGWLLQAARRSGRHFGDACRRVAGDARWDRRALDPSIAFAFAAGWWISAFRMLFAPRSERRRLLGALLSGAP